VTNYINPHRFQEALTLLEQKGVVARVQAFAADRPNKDELEVSPTLLGETVWHMAGEPRDQFIRPFVHHSWFRDAVPPIPWARRLPVAEEP